MKKYTCPCFVRVEDTKERKELIKWLESIGYTVGNSSKSGDGKSLLTATCRGGVFIIICASLKKYWLPLFSKRIDCGTNIELFKALAAMNDIDDYMQWFTDGNEFILCDEDAFACMWSNLCSGYGNRANERCNDLSKFIKATEEEIINRFKKNKSYEK